MGRVEEINHQDRGGQVRGSMWIKRRGGRYKGEFEQENQPVRTVRGLTDCNLGKTE